MVSAQKPDAGVVWDANDALYSTEEEESFEGLESRSRLDHESLCLKSGVGLEHR